MRSSILVSVLCTIALLRVDAYHDAGHSNNKLHFSESGHQVQQNKWSQPVESNEIVHQHSPLPYAPATPYTHSAPSVSGEVEHQQYHAHQVAPAAHSSQYIFNSVAPAQSHYQHTVHSHHNKPVPAQYHGQAASHYEAPIYSHYQQPTLSHTESHEAVVESIVNSGHFEPSHNEVVHKHVSIHEPQSEGEQTYLPIIQQQQAQKNKHYKIIFVKAPSAQPKAPVIHVPSAQQEEKTLVYVLHKKPGQIPDVVLPEPKPTQVNKPEVFYVNYEAKKKDQKQEDHSQNVVSIAPETPILEAYEQQEDHHNHHHQH